MRPSSVSLPVADHDSGRAAGDDQGSGIGHASAIADGRFGRDGRGRFVGGHRFAGQRGFLRAQVLDLDKPDVRRDLVAGFEGHDIARHERFGRDHGGLPVAQGPRFRREHVADRIEGLLRPAFLDEAEQSVDDDDTEDDRGVEPQTHHQLDETGGDEDIDEDVLELHEEAHERAALARGRQQVEAILSLAAGGFDGVEARRHVALEPLDDLFRSEGMPRARVCRVHCSSSMGEVAARSRWTTARQA